MTIGAGQRLGPYEVLAPLGAGGMGEVYRARDTRLGRDVAIKVLLPAARSDPERSARFELEARATSALSHPNIMALYDVGIHEGSPYVVSELLEGQSLAERLEGGPLPFRKALDYARQMAEGLAAAHAKGIIHRDLKPQNVFITRDGRAKLLDFGLARLVETDGRGTDEADTQGRILGTVGYMSPEQVRGETADGRSDIFSFGTVLYEMLTGRRAFRGNTAVETMNGILKSDPVPFADTVSGFPPGLERIVWHCLEKAPEERFQSARDLAFDLDTVSTVASLPALPLLPARVRPRTLRLVAGGLLAGLAVVALAFLLGSRDRETVPTFKRLTFRRGSIESARFAPDASTVVFGGAWGGSPVEVFAGRLDSPESRSLGFATTEILAISRAGEMALSMGRRRIGTFVGAGTLARVPLAGGAPREVLGDVQQADWAPDGAGLAVVRSVSGRNRLEFPPGNVLYEAAGWIADPRFSPDGDAIAFLDHPVWGDDGGNVGVVGRSGRARLLTLGWSSLQGLSWSRDGAEVWFTGTRDGAARALHGVTRRGVERPLLRVAGALTLHDVSRDGRVLVSHHVIRREMMARAPGGPRERDLSWLDYSFASGLSDDGSTVFFAENGEGGGAGYSLYLRKTDGSPAVRLGEGAAMALSPDRRWALGNQNYTSETPTLVLLPTGVGDARALPRNGINTHAAAFFPDGRRLLLTGTDSSRTTRVYVQDVETGATKPVGPDGTRFSLPSNPITPDGRAAVLREADGNQRLFAVDGGEGRPIPGLTQDDQPIRWSADGRSLFVYRPGELPARVVRLDVVTGRRKDWLEVAPDDRAGVLAVTPVLLTPDGIGYVFGYRRVLSDLYVIDGVK